eukprot:CAMPEP_0113934068 /NCGR_PEP_ID=MMETSP1339-20121228/1392_1 /TAXON_ID=94617 /ORGANISM="Fibrocapsa japonica" /LENGTH=294 /DNA_ID=CAMNT_0000935693 /DNA_START=136 /DNA_END=1020 /DNA_ORIENTATION=- /assembly_acc=CAM_ASM_000762
MGMHLTQADEECAGISVNQGEGIVVDIDKEEISKVGDATFDAADDSVILAHGADKDGALKFGSILQKLGVDRFDFGMQFGLRVKTAESGESGYGFILSYGGDENCVHERVMNRDGRLFSDDSEQFCKGITLAVWLDGAKKGLFLLKAGHLEAELNEAEDLEIFDKWNCITMRVQQPTEDEPGEVTFLVDEEVVAHPVHFHTQDLEGDGSSIFAYGSTPKEGEGAEIEMRDIEFKTTRDTRSLRSLLNAKTTVNSTTFFAFPMVAVVMMAFIGKFAYDYGRRSNFEDIGDADVMA